MNGTDFRLFNEKYAIYRLAEHLNVPVGSINHLSRNNPTSIADAEHGGSTFDIKYAIPTLTSKIKRKTVWDFDIHKKLHGKNVGHYGADYLLCVGMLKAIPYRVFLIPTKYAPKRHLRVSITGKSKWHAYEI